MKIYSHSKLSAFEQCQLKYKFRYIDKIIPEIEKTIEAHLGDIVHRTLEWLYSEVKEKRIPTIDDIIVYYSQTWMEEDRETLMQDGTNEKDFFNKGVQYLLNYYNRYKPFDDNTLEVEKEITLLLDEAGEYQIRGFIDRLSYNLKNNEYEIHDYKTSKTMPPQNMAENDRQLALYSIAIKELFGKDKNVKLIWHYLFFNHRIESKRTHEQLEQLKKETLELIKTIESTTEFPATISRLCGWCPYKPVCPVWNSSSSSEEYQPKFEKQKKIGEF
jgi:putative RecB family exonuclease